MPGGVPWVFCGRRERHPGHGPTCPGTGKCGDRAVHEPHLVTDGSLAPFWCFGDRVRLYREKHVSVDGRTLLDTVWADEPLPLLMVEHRDDGDQTGHFTAVLVGRVESIQRERDTGWVTGLVTLDKPQSLTGWTAEADFDHVEDFEEVNGVLVTTGARLRAVTLGHRPCWDEMRIP
jgi:hypothetical protein